MQITLGIGTILILSSIILGISLIIVVILLSGILSEVSKVSEINTRTFKMDHNIQALITNFQLTQLEEQFNQSEKVSRDNDIVTYRSPDGAHSARTPEELFMKMASDPKSGVSQEDLEALRRVFEKLAQEMEEDDDEGII